MCGIFFSIYNSKTDEQTPKRTVSNAYVKELLLRRGPDISQEISNQLTEHWMVHIIGSVLWTQGAQKTSQPLKDSDGNLFLWNGDVLSGSLDTENTCDSETVFESCKADPLLTLSRICGPYAFVFWQNTSRQLWFGRDVFGRQSLLWSVSSHHLALSSVAHRQSDLEEVPAAGVFMVDLSGVRDCLEVQLFPWAHLSFDPPSVPNVKVMIKQRLVHYVLGDESGRSAWLDTEPGEGEVFEFTPNESCEILLGVPEVQQRVDTLLDKLSEAVACRVRKQPGVCRVCTKPCRHCSVAVLFSGGLDSTILALLADKYIPSGCPIDLYNVAFRKNASGFDVPDRITGRSSLEEIRRLLPNRCWNFVEIDVERDELDLERSSRVADLIHPLSSVLDDSLGCALWFAARGRGWIDGTLYTSPARVVLLGMGADEQLGGYTRHRNTLRHSGQWAILGRELTADTDNIGRRNLGRDNRVVSDHGRQPRTPFLDERVVAYINTLPPWHRCLPTRDRPPGVGDKLLLRLAAWRLGLRTAALLPKRALQFGSRIANPKEKGNQVSQRI